MEVLAAGFIGGDALYGFFGSVLKASGMEMYTRSSPQHPHRNSC
jgi:hypothetical protein